jgi:hypothetical protein
MASSPKRRRLFKRARCANEFGLMLSASHFAIAFKLSFEGNGARGESRCKCEWKTTAGGLDQRQQQWIIASHKHTNLRVHPPRRRRRRRRRRESFMAQSVVSKITYLHNKSSCFDAKSFLPLCVLACIRRTRQMKGI